MVSGTVSMINMSQRYALLYYTIYAACPIKGTMANSIDSDQMPQNVASDQGLHCLHLNRNFYKTCLQ